MEGAEIKKRHALRVAAAALRLAVALGTADQELAFIGGLCHDLDRSLPKHDLKVRARLLAMGNPNLAAVVGVHTELALPLLNYIGKPSLGSDRHLADEKSYSELSSEVMEAALCVHLADKYIQGAAPASLEERFDPSWAVGKGPEVFEAIQRRYAAARELERLFFRRTNQSPIEVALRPIKHPLEEMAKRQTIEHNLDAPLVVDGGR
jgi:hypothetical protein